MNKHNSWLKGRENINSSNEFESFSLFQFSIKIVLSLNLILSVIMILDFLFVPKQISGFAEEDFNSQIKITLSDKSYEIVKVDNKVNSKIRGTEKVLYYSTPIFNHSKYFFITFLDGTKVQINNYELVLTLLFTIVNLAAFFLFVVFPNKFDSKTRDLDVRVSDLFLYRYDLFDHAELFLFLIAIPVIIGAVYWVELFYYIFST